MTSRNLDQPTTLRWQGVTLDWSERKFSTVHDAARYWVKVLFPKGVARAALFCDLDDGTSLNEQQLGKIHSQARLD